MIKIKIAKHDTVEFESSCSAKDAFEAAGIKNNQQILAARFNGMPIDLYRQIEESGNLEPISLNEPDGLEIIRHSCAHLMAQAVCEIYGGRKNIHLGVGPVIEHGFYYDMDVPEKISEDDFPKIEKKMKEISERDLKIQREDVSKEEALRVCQDDPFKVELIQGLEDGTISFYRQGEFFDLCRGPHVPSTKALKHFKLLKIAGAYWRGNEKNPMLQRIYGTAFPDAKALRMHLKFLEEAEKRDHRKLAKSLKLFSIQHEKAGPGLIFWHPRGAIIRKTIEDAWREMHLQHGYEFLYTPHTALSNLWKISGHLDFYKENMFSPMDIDGRDYILKPMNCPFHILIFRSDMRSYRDLPKRWAELGTVYRYERSGVLHGLMRVRGFTQDDAHIFCRPDQLQAEVEAILKFARSYLSIFGFESYEVYLSTRPKKFVGSEENWEIATKTLARAMDAVGMEYEEDPGEGVFYGPKIDLKIKDSLGRKWQCSTFQVDFNLPERFDISFINEKGEKQRPIMIHRAIMGSIERFFGVLIEHFNGNFPVWLSPEQVRILPITQEVNSAAEDLQKFLFEKGIRCDSDLRNEKIGYKIRQAELMKIPLMAVMGEREIEGKTVNLRIHGKKEKRTISWNELADFIQKLNQSKALNIT